MKKHRRQSLVRKEADCPNCDETTSWLQPRNLHRVRPKAKRCDDCGEHWR